MPIFHAIAAMSENRVIGNWGKIPWHIPEDFRWFKHKTMGGTLIMGRKTFESIGKPLPGRKTIVLSRTPMALGIDSIRDLFELDKALASLPEPYWVSGGADIYRQLIDRCRLLYLTRVKTTVEGDTFFPPFEDHFELDQMIHENAQFRVERWINKKFPLDAQPPKEAWPF
jgi:dihydrofolate reductase